MRIKLPSSIPRIGGGKKNENYSLNNVANPVYPYSKYIVYADADADADADAPYIHNYVCTYIVYGTSYKYKYIIHT